MAGSYSVPSTLLIRFADDGIDQTPEMERLLRQRFPGQGAMTADNEPVTHVNTVGSKSVL